MKLTDKIISGVSCEVNVESSGQFSVLLDGSMIGRGPSLDSAIAKASESLRRRKVKVEVPFLTAEAEEGIAYGIHGGSHKVLARVTQSDGSTTAEQIDFGGSYLPDAPRQEIDAYLAAKDRYADARRAINQFESKYRFDLKRAVERAITAKQEAETDGE